METGFAGGLAEGVEAGTRLGLQENEQKFEQSLQQKQEQRAEQEQTIRTTEENRKQAADALSAITAQEGDTARQLAIAHQNGDTSNMATFSKQMADLRDAKQHAFRNLGGADLHDFVSDAKQTGDDLHYGNKTFSDLSPQDATNWLTYTTGRPASDLIDTPDRPSPVGQAIQKFRAGVSSLQQDGGKQLLDATNDLYGHELHGLVGQHGYDGSVVTGAEFAPPVPHPDSPAHATMTAHITYRSPDGKTGEQYVPIFDDHGQILLHPDQSGDSAVKNFHMDDLFNHVGALETMYKAVNADPESKNKLIQGYLDGHEDNAAKMLDWIHVLGHDPSEYQPKRDIKVENGYLISRDASGNLTSAPLALPKIRDPAQDELDKQRGDLLAGELAALQAGRTTTGREPPQPKSVLIQDEKGNQHWMMEGDDIPEGWRAVGRSGSAASADPQAVAAQAKAIANYKQQPFSGRAAVSGPGAETMAKVYELNPDYDANKFGQVHKAYLDYGTGKQGQSVQSLNVAISHLKLVDQMADALNNGDISLFNKLGNAWAQRTGNPAPNNFDEVARIAGQEVTKAIVNGGGGEGERQEAADAFNKNHAPQTIKGATSTARRLLVGQLEGHRQTWKRTTGLDNFDDEFLTPEAKDALSSEIKPSSGAGGAGAASGKTYSKADVEAAAKRNGISYDEMAARVTAAGHKVQ